MGLLMVIVDHCGLNRTLQTDRRL